MEIVPDSDLIVIGIAVFIGELIFCAYLLQRYRSELVFSFFYYLLFADLFVLYGWFGLSGSAFFFQDPVLLKTAHFHFLIRYLALPLLIVANYFFIRFFRNLTGRSLSWRFSIAFFSFQLLLFLLTGMAIGKANDLHRVASQSLLHGLETLYHANEMVCIALALIQPFIFRSKECQWRRTARIITAYYAILVPIYFVILNAYAGQPNPWVDLLALPLYDLLVLVILAQNLRSESCVKEQLIAESSNEQLLQRYAITPRENQIIQLVCAGKSNREIASELYISLQTAKDHIYNIYRKTSVKNRVQLCNLFRNNG